MKIKNVVKKVTIAAMLATPALGAFSHSAALAASWVPNSKYYVSNPDDATKQDIYGEDADAPNRNFKRRSANIYVKDKSILPAVKKAIKLWAPKFKFKLVKSAKHASFNSAKYANIVVYDDNKGIMMENDKNGNSVIDKSGFADITCTRVYEEKNPEVIKYWHGNRYVSYASPRLNHQRIQYIKKYCHNSPLMLPGTKFYPKDWKKKAFTNHMNLYVESKYLTAQGKVNAVTQQLGRAIGLGCSDESDPREKNDIMYADQSSYNKNWRVTQDDLDHIDWIYSHPYTSIADNTVRNGSMASGL
ncbi:hypothetical protein FP435_03655 [Lactobacillus sp. PV037]|uniref:hypothetical protein n=1 Tax=Lactobacillus sp. PV037 TaxID=2594496 RepID=UPI002240BBCE|nr:hypothetical protein [Lactobacillus sp. PV037]QNQ83602.1 hypothetical protein FP435_03655 [Lactobacillus sp. PV037]